MKLLNEYIDTVRIKLKEVGDDHLINIPDEVIADTIIGKRSVLLARKAKSREPIHPLNWMTVCMPLSKGKYADCDCLPAGLKCTVLRSDSEVPTFIMGRRKGLIKIRKFNGETLFSIDPEEYNELEFSKVKKNELPYSFENSHLLVWDKDLRLKAVVLNIVPSNPLDLAEITMCDASGNPTEQTCYDPTTQRFPMDGDLADVVIDLVIEHFVNLKRLPVDAKNEGADTNG